MKRFYKTVEILERDKRFYIALDGNMMKTPHKNDLSTDNKAVATVIKLEWDLVDVDIDATKMPMTKYINTLIDKIQPQRAQMNALLVEYIHHDAICYFAGGVDEDFHKIQTEKWLPILQEFNQKFDLDVQTTTGIMPLMQDDKITDFAAKYAASLNPLDFMAFYQLVTMTGSFILGVLTFEKDMMPAQSLELSLLEEKRNSEKWGEDAESTKQLQKKKFEWNDAIQLLELVR